MKIRNKKVYMAGPDNLMLLLHTVRAILRDATMSQTAGKIQIEVDKLNDELIPFLTTIPLQKLAFYSALEKGYDIDKPRNLAKSVTVE